jgi:hypothetical protein
VSQKPLTDQLKLPAPTASAVPVEPTHQLTKSPHKKYYKNIHQQFPRAHVEGTALVVVLATPNQLCDATNTPGCVVGGVATYGGFTGDTPSRVAQRRPEKGGIQLASQCIKADRIRRVTRGS